MNAEKLFEDWEKKLRIVHDMKLQNICELIKIAGGFDDSFEDLPHNLSHMARMQDITMERDVRYGKTTIRKINGGNSGRGPLAFRSH